MAEDLYIQHLARACSEMSRLISRMSDGTDHQFEFIFKKSGLEYQTFN